MNRFCILAALVIAGSVGAFGQYTYSGSSLSYDAENVYASVYVETDYETAQYYDLYIIGTLEDCYFCGSVIAEGSNGGYTTYASWSTTVPVSASWYSVWSTPYLLGYYEVYVGNRYYYEDPYGYSLVETEDGDPSIYEYAPDDYEYSGAQEIVVDGAYQAVLANGPPAYVQVTQDYQNICTICKTTVARVTTYQVMQANKNNVGNMAICEVVTPSDWSCTQGQPTLNTLACGQESSGTNSSGQFTDTWSLNSDNFTPAGCGFNATTDAWKRPNLNGTYTTFGLLQGSLLTNSTTINGYKIVGASTTGAMPNGFIINP